MNKSGPHTCSYVTSSNESFTYEQVRSTYLQQRSQTHQRIRVPFHTHCDATPLPPPSQPPSQVCNCRMLCQQMHDKMDAVLPGSQRVEGLILAECCHNICSCLPLFTPVCVEVFCVCVFIMCVCQSSDFAPPPKGWIAAVRARLAVL